MNRKLIFLLLVLLVGMFGSFAYKSSNVINTPNKQIIPNGKEFTQQYKDTTLDLYFSKGEMLVREERNIKIKQTEYKDSQTLAKVIIEELIIGPTTKEIYATIPKGTKVNSVTIDNGTAIVDLSEEFVTNHIGSSEAETLTVYSIVNSLTQLPNVDKVKFLINGQIGKNFNDFTIYESFERDENLIQK